MHFCRLCSPIQKVPQSSIFFSMPGFKCTFLIKFSRRLASYFGIWEINLYRKKRWEINLYQCNIWFMSLLTFFFLFVHVSNKLVHSVWKSPKMLHLSLLILAFSTNFCPIKIGPSGNTVWPHSLDFQNRSFLAFLINFCPLKM